MTEQSYPDPEIVEMQPQNLAAIRERLPFDELPALYDRAFPLIFAALEKQGLTPIAPPIGVTHDMSDGVMDLSVTVPVEREIETDGEVHALTLPAGRFAQLLVKGGYDRLGDGYTHLMAWLEANNETVGDYMWEQYLTEPTPEGNPDDNETLIAAHLA